MRWRQLRLDWGYAIGELIIVTAGVLIALAIDQWNSDRLDRVDETLIIAGLISDLEFDRMSIELGLGFMPEKQASLQRVYAILNSSDETIQDPAGFLGDITEGSRYGWVQFVARRNTFDELIGSGRFNLIRDSRVRSRISEYYASVDEIRNRIAERTTIYPEISYQLVLRTDEFELDPSLTVEHMSRLAISARRTLPVEAVIAEINFSRFVRIVLTEADELRARLSAELSAYRATIQ